MKKVSLDTWIHLLGMVGLLGGLIFVGLEMRQSQRIAMAAQQADRFATITAGITPFYEIGVDWHSIAYLNRPDLSEQFSIGEASARNNYHLSLFLFENDYFQYTQGLMPDDVWAAKLQSLTFFYNQCNHRDLMDRRKLYFSSDLRDVIDSLPDNCAE